MLYMEQRNAKIRVIGAPGTGKSYFSRKLEQKLKIEKSDLDDIFWSSDAEHHRKKRDISERNDKLERILKQESWIIEGVYYAAWTKDTFEAADVIVYLKTFTITRLYRMTKREVMKKMRASIPKVTWKNFKDLIIWSMGVDAYIENEVNKWRATKKVIVLTSKRERKLFLKDYDTM